MEFPRIEITRQDAEIEIRSHRARVEISTRRSQFRTNKNHAQFRVDHRMPTMHVDRSQTLTALGVGPVLQSARQFFADSLQRGIDSIAIISAEGDTLMRIENGGNPLADLGVQASEPATVEINTGALPQAAIDWEPGYFSINWTPASMNFEWDVSTLAEFRVEPHYVEVIIKKYPEVKIRFYYEPRQIGAAGGHGKIVDKYL